MTLDHSRSHWASAAEARNTVLVVVVAGVVGVVVVDGIQTVVDMTAFVAGSCTAWQHFSGLKAARDIPRTQLVRVLGTAEPTSDSEAETATADMMAEVLAMAPASLCSFKI